MKAFYLFAALVAGTVVSAPAAADGTISCPPRQCGLNGVSLDGMKAGGISGRLAAAAISEPQSSNTDKVRTQQQPEEEPVTDSGPRSNVR